MNKVKAWFTPKHRKWIYKVLVAGSAVGVYYGVVTKEDVTVWLNFVTALGLGMAHQNVTED